MAHREDKPYTFVTHKVRDRRAAIACKNCRERKIRVSIHYRFSPQLSIQTHHYGQCKVKQEGGPPYPTCERCSKYGLDCEYISVANHTSSSSRPQSRGSQSGSSTQPSDSTDEDTSHLLLRPTMSEWNLSTFEPYPSGSSASATLPLLDSEPNRSQNFSTSNTAYTAYRSAYNPERPLNTIDPSYSYSSSNYQPLPSRGSPMSLSRGRGSNQHWQDRWQPPPIHSAFPGLRTSHVNPPSMYHTNPAPTAPTSYDTYGVDLSLATQRVPQPMIPSGEQMALMYGETEQQNMEQNM
jgi:hypothetical protein